MYSVSFINTFSKATNMAHVYVLKHRIDHGFLTTRVDGKSTPGIVAFTDKRHAANLRKLMNYKVNIECIGKTTITRLSDESHLNVVIYDNMCNVHVHVPTSPQNKDIEQFRFLLETTYRYY